MKNIRLFLFLVLSISIFSVVFLSTVVKAQEGTVTATVTIGVVSVTVTPTSFDYGAMPFGSQRESFDVIDVSGDKNIKATVGGVLTNLDIKGADTAGWTLESSVGENQYTHNFGVATDATTVAASYTALTTSYDNVLGTNLAATSDVWFGLSLGSPSSGVGTQQSAVVTVLASWSE